MTIHNITDKSGNYEQETKKRTAQPICLQKEAENEKTQEKIGKLSLPTNKEDKTRELRKLIETMNLRHPGRYVAEQLRCLLHVKELKVITTELERQIGD